MLLPLSCSVNVRGGKNVMKNKFQQLNTTCVQALLHTLLRTERCLAGNHKDGSFRNCSVHECLRIPFPFWSTSPPPFSPCRSAICTARTCISFPLLHPLRTERRQRNKDPSSTHTISFLNRSSVHRNLSQQLMLLGRGGPSSCLGGARISSTSTEARGLRLPEYNQL